MAELLSTSSVKPHERFAFWREAVCDTYVQLGCESDATNHFSGQILINHLPTVSTSFVAGSRQTVTRRRRDIRNSNEECFLISLQLEADGVIAQCGREALIRPGDFALYSSVDQYQLRLPDNFRQLVIQIPRDDLLRKLPSADLLTGIRIPGESIFDGLIGDNVTRMINAIEHSNDVVRQCTQDIITDLFVAGLASLENAKYELSLPEQQILLRANALIHSNLKNPELDRNMLAAAMGMSVRRLNEIYHSNGSSISSAIREMRLSQIAKELKDARFYRLSITELAYKWGFTNPQNLIRNFKQHYGVTPSEYRKPPVRPEEAKHR
ncbi:MAG: helix-turn-helix domain-containing protein [Pseudomonadota bacterium]